MKIYLGKILLFVFWVQIFGLSAQQSDSILLESLGFNTSISDEICPFIVKDGLVFSSNRKSDIIVSYKDTAARHLMNLYKVFTKDSIKLKRPSAFHPSLNTIFHDGPACFSVNEDTIFITRNQLKENRGKQKCSNNLGIYWYVRSGEDWKELPKIPFIKPDYSYAHPAYDSKNQVLYFSSNMHSDKAGLNLFYSVLEDSTWTEPQELPADINSKSNEMFPFIHNSGRLYYSSDKPGGEGGLDIYYTWKKDGNWHMPVPMEAPVNSAYDDFGYVCDSAFRMAYFSSNRNGSDDIFRYRTVLPEFTACEMLKVNNHCYVFYEDGSMDLDTTSLQYEWDMGDGTKVRGLEADHCFTESGNYIVQLNVIDTATGEIYISQASYMMQIEDEIQPYINSPDTVQVGESFKLDATRSYLPGLDIQEYYWNFGGGSRARGQSTEHIFREPGLFEIQLGIIGINMEGEKKKHCVVKNIVVINE